MRNERRRKGSVPPSSAEWLASQARKRSMSSGRAAAAAGRADVVMMRESATVDAQAQASSPRQLAVRAQLRFRDGHRAADVEHEIDARRDLLAIETDGQELGPRIGGPIDMAEVVAGRVGR